jgi:hypothetical protein
LWEEVDYAPAGMKGTNWGWNKREGAHPYLGAGHEYLEKTPSSAPYLGDIHVHNPAGFVSFGWPEGDVPSMRRGVAAIVACISRDLFLADLELHQRRLTADVAPDFAETLYAAAIGRPPGDTATG